MASIVKRKKSRFYTACFTDRDGRQLKRSTKTTDRNQAMGIAIELERVERQAQAGALTTTQLRKVLSDVSEKITGDSLIAPSVTDYLDDWLKGVEARSSPATLERYKNTKKIFLLNLGAKAKGAVTAVTPNDIENFLNSRLKSGAAPKTAIVDLKTLNTAFRRAENYQIILKNPVAAIRMPKEDCSEREVFTQEEVKKLLDNAPILEWQTLILLGYFVGARLSDCVQMKWENVDAENGVIIYQQKKTGKKVIVPMHFHILEHLNYLSAHSRRHVGGASVRRLSRGIEIGTSNCPYIPCMQGQRLLTGSSLALSLIYKANRSCEKKSGCARFWDRRNL